MQAVAAFPTSSTPGLVQVDQPPAPAAGQVLCRTLELGVCGTDREILLSRQPLVPPGGEFLILGHECLAEVVAVGSGVDQFQLGELVVPVVRRPRSGGAEHARVDFLPFGQYTERGIVWEHGFSQLLWLDEPRHLFRVEPELASVAVLTEPLAVAAKAIHEAICVQQARLGATAWVSPPPRVLVTGMGPIGFAALLGSVRRGWPTTILGRDQPDSLRASLARSFGAEYLGSQDLDFHKLHESGDGFDLVLECTGSEEVIVESAAALAACGVMAWLGSSRAPRPSEVNLARMVRDGLLRNHIHLGTVNAAPRDFADALATLRHFQAALPSELGRLITARVTLKEALWHYEHRETQGIKTVVEF